MDTNAVAPSTRRRHVVELLDLGKTDIHLRPPALAAFRNQVGQSVQGLRAEHEVDIGRAFDDGRTFLTGDTTADADQQARVVLLQMLDPTQIMKHLFLRLFAH